jgi:hypothetical protein
MPPDVLFAQAAEALIDALLVHLRTILRAVFVLAVIVAVVGLLTGSSRSAVAVRAAYRRAVERVRSRRTGQDPHSIESAVSRFHVPLRVGMIAIGLMTLVFWRYPTGPVVITTAVATSAALLVVKLVARPASDESGDTDAAETSRQPTASATNGDL